MRKIAFGNFCNLTHNPLDRTGEIPGKIPCHQQNQDKNQRSGEKGGLKGCPGLVVQYAPVHLCFQCPPQGQRCIGIRQPAICSTIPVRCQHSTIFIIQCDNVLFGDKQICAVLIKNLAGEQKNQPARYFPIFLIRNRMPVKYH